MRVSVPAGTSGNYMASYSEGTPASYAAGNLAGNLGSNGQGYRDGYAGNDSARNTPGCGLSSRHSCPISNRETNDGSYSGRNGPSYLGSNGRSNPGSNLEDSLWGSPPDEGRDFRGYTLAR